VGDGMALLKQGGELVGKVIQQGKSRGQRSKIRGSEVGI